MNVKPLSIEPRMFLLQDALTAPICAGLRALVTPALEPAMVYLPGPDGRRNRVATEHRSGDTAFVSPHHEAARSLVNLARLFTGQPLSHFEDIQIARYMPGQEYRRHHDTFDDAEGEDYKLRGGQRTWSVLAYLNDVWEGGGTYFDALGIQVYAFAGHVLIWENVDAGGRPDPRAYHAALPPTSGEKWSAAIWIREREYVRRV